MLARLVQMLDALMPATLTRELLLDIPEAQGVYQLFLDPVFLDGLRVLTSQRFEASQRASPPEKLRLYTLGVHNVYARRR